VPQTEEDIHEVKWVPQSEIKKYINQTYASVADVLKAGVLKQLQ
jgi:uncharacterized HAD superfamily protein